MTRNQKSFGSLVGLATYVTGAGALADLVRRTVKRQRSEAALKRLSPAWLTDLGLTPAEVPLAAEAAAVAAVPYRESLPGQIYGFVKMQQARRAAYRQLAKLDERLLTDIGIEPTSLYNVAGVVGLPKKLVAETAPAATLGHWKDLGLQRLSAAKLAALDFRLARPANSQGERQAA